MNTILPELMSTIFRKISNSSNFFQTIKLSFILLPSMVYLHTLMHNVFQNKINVKKICLAQFLLKRAKKNGDYMLIIKIKRFAIFASFGDIFGCYKSCLYNFE